MRSLTVSLSVACLLGTGCPGGDGYIGESCDGHGSCARRLQCVHGVCVPRCQRATDCGDGYACDAEGLCVEATGRSGDACTSEVDCEAGLSCQLDPTIDDTGRLRASCAPHNPGRPAGSECNTDLDCRNGTCALGRCVDLCAETRDCGAGLACMSIPRVEDPANGALFDGCLPASGTLVWDIPVQAPSAEILIPIPDAARSATVVMRVDDVAQRVGAERVFSPSDPESSPSYEKPCEPAPQGCSDVQAADELFAQRLRHLPAAGQSVLQIPTSSAVPLEAGAYRMRVSSFRSNGSQGSAIPHVTVVTKMDDALTLDLHFYFLDLADHPCRDGEQLGAQDLDATRAKTATLFQEKFVGTLRTILAGGGLELGQTTYEDVDNHPELDGLALGDAGALLSLGAHSVGLNVFFVRTLSPVGLQAFGPNPGPAGLAGTRQSGIVVGIDTLCYRTWSELARLTAHEAARYMGLFHNVELEVEQHPTWRDPIDDSDDASSNLMFFSEHGGRDLSPGQREILTKSPVLR